MTNQHPITPPPELVERWKDNWWAAKIKHINLEDYILAQAAQWGADQAAATMRHQWPEPITDRLPTEADGDEDGYVQYLNQYQRWNDASWHGVASASRPWFHTPHWRPKPPSLKEHALATLHSMQIEPCMINGVNTIADLMAKYDILRRALEALPND